MKQLLKRMKHLNTYVKIGLSISFLSFIMVSLLAFISMERDIIILALITAIIFSVEVAYFYIQTKGFTKFAKVNDERVLIISKEAFVVAGKSVMSIALFIAGILSGRLYSRYKIGVLLWTNVDVIQLTIVAVTLLTVCLFFGIYTIVYVYLKYKK